jgi:hypothetical protein
MVIQRTGCCGTTIKLHAAMLSFHRRREILKYFLVFHSFFTNWASKYCTHRGCLLVDATEELFRLFHFYVVKSAEYVTKTLMRKNCSLDQWESLSKWCSCSFTGDENFADVKEKLRGDVEDIRQYLDFILQIPFLQNLIRDVLRREKQYVCVTFIMSFAAFKNFCKNNNLARVEEISGQDATEDATDYEESTHQRELTTEQKEAEAAWRETFYYVYSVKFTKMKNSTLITREKYDQIVNVLLELQQLRGRANYKGPIPKDALRFDKIYELKANIGSRCLYRNNLLVTTFEDVFEVMYNTHMSLGHARDIKKNKARLDQVYYSIPESCVKDFLKLCPYCCPARNKKKKNKVPLKMILTPRIGHRAQIDLIDMGALAINGTRYILRYVDHLSGFSQIHALMTKSAEEVGIKLIQILSTAVIPEILQSDNGNEFLGTCIEIIKSFYPYIHIVKGRAYHPQSQGKVERGHAPFKEALQKWMAKYGTNWMIGAFVVNHEINQRAQWNRDNLSPYNMMYGKIGTQRNNVVFGEAAVTYAKTEYGVLAAKFFCTTAKKWAASRLVTEMELKYVMEQGKYLLQHE